MQQKHCKNVACGVSAWVGHHGLLIVGLGRDYQQRTLSSKASTFGGAVNAILNCGLGSLFRCQRTLGSCRWEIMMLGALFRSIGPGVGYPLVLQFPLLEGWRLRADGLYQGMLHHPSRVIHHGGPPDWSSAFSLWTDCESFRIKMRHVWVYFVLSTCVAFAFAAPLFLFVRERHLEQRLGPGNPRQTWRLKMKHIVSMLLIVLWLVSRMRQSP